MTAPAVNFDEWLIDHLDDLITHFLNESRDDCYWLFFQFAHEEYGNETN